MSSIGSFKIQVNQVKLNLEALEKNLKDITALNERIEKAILRIQRLKWLKISRARKSASSSPTSSKQDCMDLKL